MFGPGVFFSSDFLLDRLDRGCLVSVRLARLGDAYALAWLYGSPPVDLSVSALGVLGWEFLEVSTFFPNKYFSRSIGGTPGPLIGLCYGEPPTFFWGEIWEVFIGDFSDLMLLELLTLLWDLKLLKLLESSAIFFTGLSFSECLDP